MLRTIATSVAGLPLLLIACGGVESGAADSGATADAVTADATSPDAASADAATCEPGVTVTYSGSTLPAELPGFYDEAFDCVRAEGGAFFGGVDETHCFRKNDGSAWRVWNTGCGWEIGRVENGQWEREARTYSGLCSEIPPQGLTTLALTTNILFDGFGDSISDLSSALVECDM